MVTWTGTCYTDTGGSSGLEIDRESAGLVLFHHGSLRTWLTYNMNCQFRERRVRIELEWTKKHPHNASQVIVTTSCNLLLAKTGRCQIGDSLHLTDPGESRQNEVKVFGPWKALKWFSITVECFVFLVIAIWSCHWQVWSTNSMGSEQELFKWQGEGTSCLWVSGFLLDYAKGVRKICFIRGSSVFSVAWNSSICVVWHILLKCPNTCLHFFRNRKGAAEEPVKEV